MQTEISNKRRTPSDDEFDLKLSTRALGTNYHINPNINIEQYRNRIQKQYTDKEWLREQHQAIVDNREYVILVREVSSIVRDVKEIMESGAPLYSRQSELCEKRDVGVKCIEQSQFFPFLGLDLDQLVNLKEQHKRIEDKIAVIKRQVTLLVHMTTQQQDYLGGSSDDRGNPTSIAALLQHSINNNSSKNSDVAWLNQIVKDVARDKIAELEERYRQAVQAEKELACQIEQMQTPADDMMELVDLYIQLRYRIKGYANF